MVLDSTVNKKRIQDGFPGQRMVVLPDKLIDDVAKNPLTSGLYLTDMGYFPRARFHYRERQSGSQEYILIYCVEGKGIIEIPETRLEVRSNSYCIIPPGTPHNYQSFSTTPWSIYWVHFKGLQSSHLFKKYSPNGEPLLRDVVLDERRLGLFDSIMDTLEAGFAAHHLEFVNLSLIQLISSFLYQGLYSGGGPDQHDLVNRAVQLMKAELEKRLSINDFAARVNCSPSHFYALFKHQTGYSPLQYFNQLKIQRSCHLLSFTDLTIKEISCKTGIDDQFYFSRLFKKVMGLSPAQYRIKYKD